MAWLAFCAIVVVALIGLCLSSWFTGESEQARYYHDLDVGFSPSQTNGNGYWGPGR